MKKFVTNNDEFVDAEGTSYKGTIHTKYDTIVKRFGKPEEGGSDDKTQAEWAIKFENGVIATIYDWKQNVALERVTKWNIGGFDNRALTYIREVMNG